MNGNNTAVDIDFEPVPPPKADPAISCPGTSERVIAFPGSSAGFPRKFREPSPEPPKNLLGTTAGLAETHGVSEKTIRSWLSRFTEAVPASMLVVGRGTWSPLAIEMCQDWAECRAQGMAIDAWLDERSGIYAPAEAAVAEAFVEGAQRQGAIIPAAVRAGAESQQAALAQISEFRGFAAALAGELVDQLRQIEAQAAQTEAAMDSELAQAQEMVRFMRERKQAATARAALLDAERQSKMAALQRELDELRGGEA